MCSIISVGSVIQPKPYLWSGRKPQNKMMLEPTYFQNKMLRYKNFNMNWFSQFICVSDLDFHLACSWERALLCEQEAGSFFIFKFCQLFLVFWEIWWLFYTVFPLIYDHTVSGSESPVVSNGSVPPAQQRCVQMSNERVAPVVFLCVDVWQIMDCVSGWCNNIVSASLIYSLCFPVPYCAVFYQFSFQ